MDYPQYIPPYVRTLALVAALFPGVAQAGAISNLTDKEQVVEIQTTDGYVPIRIAAGRTRRTDWPVRIKFYEKEIYLPVEMEYAIWPGGVFGPQRVRREYLR